MGKNCLHNSSIVRVFHMLEHTTGGDTVAGPAGHREMSIWIFTSKIYLH
uniref:Uncharacterized protein n=1 Tax=Anguilla anguilla TaxID=7936 RepID=A0A0E9URW3_ANGAN